MTLLVASGEILPPATAQSVAYTGITTFTPKVVLFFSNTTAAGSIATGAWQIVGASDGTSHGTMHWAESSTLAASNVIRGFATASAILVANTNATSIRHAAALTAFSPTGFTLNWTTSSAADQSIQWLALGGSGLSVKVGNFATGTGTSDVPVTGVGFQPKVILFFGGRGTTTVGLTNGSAGSCTGFGAAIDATHRWASSVVSDDADTTIDTSQGLFDDRCFQLYGTNAATTNGTLDFVSMDAGGFTVIPDAAFSADTTLFYVALGGASLSAALGTDAQKAATGTQAKIGTGFLPELLLLKGNGAVTLNTTADGISSFMGVAHGAANRVIAMSDDDNVADTASGSSTSATKCAQYITGGTPTLVAEANLSTFDANGYTLDWTTADATVRLFGFVALAYTPIVAITSNGGGATATVDAAERQTVVTTVVATTTGTDMVYSISGGADSALFGIDSVTGVLEFLSVPDYETPLDDDTDNDYIVEVTAADGAVTDVQTITVTVTDVDEDSKGGWRGGTIYVPLTRGRIHYFN